MNRVRERERERERERVVKARTTHRRTGAPGGGGIVGGGGETIVVVVVVVGRLQLQRVHSPPVRSPATHREIVPHYLHCWNKWSKFWVLVPKKRFFVSSSPCLEELRFL